MLWPGPPSPNPTRREALRRAAGVLTLPALGLSSLGLSSLGRPALARAGSPTDYTAGLPAPRLRDASFRRGASLGLFIKDADRDYARSMYSGFLDEMPFAGVTDLQLVTRWDQTDVRADVLGPGPETDDETLKWVVDAAHARGLRVFLMPIIHVRRRAKGEWRGTIDPRTPERWWAAYRHFVMHYARLAQATGVELFAVGSELVSRERFVKRWRALIAEVRGVYSGQLTYSANWDHFEPVQFWDALDIAGLNGYHAPALPAGNGMPPLTDEDALVRGWRSFTQRVRHWSAIIDKPYIITEIGYPSVPFAATRPWDHETKGVADPEMQLRLYRALFRAWHNEPGLGGLYIWNWFGDGGPDDTSYTPRGKPAMHVIDWWYSGARG